MAGGPKERLFGVSAGLERAFGRERPISPLQNARALFSRASLSATQALVRPAHPLDKTHLAGGPKEHFFGVSDVPCSSFFAQPDRVLVESKNQKSVVVQANFNVVFVKKMLFQSLSESHAGQKYIESFQKLQEHWINALKLPNTDASCSRNTSATSTTLEEQEEESTRLVDAIPLINTYRNEEHAYYSSGDSHCRYKNTMQDSSLSGSFYSFVANIWIDYSFL